MRQGVKEYTEEISSGGRVLRPEDVVYDLNDVVEEGILHLNRQEREIIVIDGRVYERVPLAGDKVFDLQDVVGGDTEDQILKRVSEIAEKIAREIIPDIAEKVIREEIEKLKA